MDEDIKSVILVAVVGSMFFVLMVFLMIMGKQ